LQELVGERKSGFLFQSKNGKPLSSSNILKRHPHPALEKLGYVNQATGSHKAGSQAFRRFRNTYLREITLIALRASISSGWVMQMEA
jgi:hypothetical protein